MNRELIIKVDNITKMYKLYNKPMDRFIEIINFKKKKLYKSFLALSEVSFEVYKGEVLGIIGENGSGKSTLLKIITGVLSQTNGNIYKYGKVNALLELGAGFNQEYTGLENIELSATIYGIEQNLIEKKKQEIMDFANLGEFIYQPVKNYSSGMFVRLAFAVATCMEPDILIVDEALSVGDIKFQAKSIGKIKDLIEKGVTVIIVSHDINTIKSLCDRVLYLKNGVVENIGDSGEVCDLYIKDTLHKEKSENNLSFSEKYDLKVYHIEKYQESIKEYRSGSGDAKLSFLTLNNNEDDTIGYMDNIKLSLYIDILSDIKNLVVAVHIKDKNQLEIFGTNTKYEGKIINNLLSGENIRVDFSCKNYLKEGEYSISVILADDVPTMTFFDYITNAFFFKSRDNENQKRWSLMGIPFECKIKRGN